MPKCRKPPKMFSLEKTEREEKHGRLITTVCEWYWNFGVKGTVTMGDLRAVAGDIAVRLQTDLPPNWLSTMRKKHGVQLEPSKKAKYSRSKKVNSPKLKEPPCRGKQIYEAIPVLPQPQPESVDLSGSLIPCVPTIPSCSTWNSSGIIPATITQPMASSHAGQNQLYYSQLIA